MKENKSKELSVEEMYGVKNVHAMPTELSASERPLDYISKAVMEEFSGLSWDTGTSWNTELASLSMMSVGGPSTFRNSILSDYAPQPIASLKSLTYLRHFHLVESILVLFGSILKDAFTKNSLNSVVKDKNGNRNEELERRVDNYIKSAKFIKLIKSDDNQDRMYYGNKGYYIYDKTYYDIENPYIGLTLEQGDKALKWVMNDGATEISPLTAIISQKKGYTFISRNHFIAYQNDPVTLYRLSVRYLKDNPTLKKELTYDEKLPDFVVPYTLKQGVSIFNAILGKIYQILIREFLIDILSLKQIMRQDILSANISPDAQNVPKVMQALKDVESGLNTGDLSFSIINPTSLMQRIMYYAANGIKVVPALQSIGIPDLVRRPDEEDKRSRLKQEKDDMTREVYQFFGVEDFFTGSANKWESIQRNSRLMNFVDKLIKNESKFIGDFLQFAVDEWTNGEEYTLDFEFDTSSIIANFTQQNLLKNFQDKVESMNAVIKATDEIASNQKVDDVKVVEYLQEQLRALDSAAAEFIKDPEDIKKDKEKGGENLPNDDYGHNLN